MNAKESNECANSELTSGDKRQLRLVLSKITKNAKKGYENKYFSSLRPRVIRELKSVGYGFVRHHTDYYKDYEITWR